MITIRDIILNPLVAGGIFGLLVYGLYRLGGVLAPKGEPHPGKRQPYACGEDLLPPEARLAYHAFFQLALMFSLLHLAALVISTLPARAESHRIAIVYLFAITISVLVLTETKGED